MPTKIYFVRHGKVKNNSNIFYGRLPRVGLSKIGIAQIEESANYLKSKKITKIFSSNLLRTKQSAATLNFHLNCHDVSRTNLITEIDSYMEGKPFEFGKASRFDHYFSPLRKPGNESMVDIRNRMINFIYRIDKKYKNKSIAVVSHGDPLMILKASVSGLSMELASIRPEDGSYIKYGEIYLVQVIDDKIIIESVFTPNQ
ncbi:MAG: histidine phosphatase family protein [Patescibacteria group bacterium]